MAVLGDPAEDRFQAVHPTNYVTFGLRRPPLQVHRLPTRIRYAPDFLTSAGFVEVQGFGREGVIRIKTDKLGALSWWSDLFPVEWFFFDSHKDAHAYVAHNEVLDAINKDERVTLDRFPEGKACFAIPRAVFFG